MSRQRRNRTVAVITMLVLTGVPSGQAWGQASSARSKTSAPPSAVPSEPPSAADRAAAPSDGSATRIDWMRNLAGQRITRLSDAELVALIRRSIEADQAELERLSAELQAENGPYEQCEAAFKRIDERFQALLSELEHFEDGEDEAQRAAIQTQRTAVQSQIDYLLPERELAKTRFDVAIERRRLVAQMVPLLQARISQAQLLKSRALGEPAAVAEPGAALDPPQSLDSVPEDELEADAGTAGSAASRSDSSGGRGAEREAPEKSLEASEELQEAEQGVRYWQEVIEAVDESIVVLESRLATIDQAVKLERGIVDNARQAVENCEAYEELWSERLERDQSVPPTPLTREEIVVARKGVRERAELARRQSHAAADRLAALAETRGFLLEALTARHKDVDYAAERLRLARSDVGRISNPFHPRNVYRWLLHHGAQLLTILLGMLLAYFSVRVVGARLVHVLACRGVRGSREERVSRADTLVNSFRQFGTLAVLVGGTLMILEEVGIPILPLLGGAAVLGLAVAFGAQNLIQDFFQGFMILLENQYKLNDVVKIGEHAGLVEQITLRTTALRSLDGTLHFIPNGQIKAVSNLTHGWSRAMFDLAVAYREDPDHVMEVIRDVCRQVREDPEYRYLILEDATILGVDAFADSAFVIKFFIKTMPLQQWTIRREILRRILKRFEAEKIEIPFPHRSLLLRSADGGALEELLCRKLTSSPVDGDA